MRNDASRSFPARTLVLCGRGRPARALGSGRRPEQIGFRVGPPLSQGAKLHKLLLNFGGVLLMKRMMDFAQLVIDTPIHGPRFEFRRRSSGTLGNGDIPHQ